MNIKEKISFLKNNGWSYRKLADHFKVSQTTVMRWHKGIYKPKYYFFVDKNLNRLINKRKIEIDFKLGQKIILKKEGYEGIIEDIEEGKDGTKYYWIGFKDNPESHLTWHGKFEENEIKSNELTDNSEEKVLKAFEELNQIKFIKCKYCGKKNYTTHEYYNYKCIDKEIAECEKKLQHLKAQKEKMKYSFTEDEKVILRNLDEKWKWIARDEDDNLWLFEKEPHKNLDFISPDKIWVGGGEFIDFTFYNHLFQCIQWSDTEPCEFRKFI